MILAILQARSSSSRLPAKVLQPLLGKPMLARQIERVLRSERIDRLVLATSTDPADDAIAAIAAETGIVCSRGSLDDVLDRFYRTAEPYRPQHIVRLTGDCPLIDPTVIDGTISFYLEGRYDYVSNALEPTFPDGLDVEVFRFPALEAAWREAVLPSHREHVTLFINQHRERFRLGNFARREGDLSGLRWTVDEPEDLEFVRRVYGALYPGNPAFTTDAVLELLRREPDLASINARFRRNEGLARSLTRDKSFPSRKSEV